jgi:hypothetical protein
MVVLLAALEMVRQQGLHLGHALANFPHQIVDHRMVHSGGF